MRSASETNVRFRYEVDVEIGTDCGGRLLPVEIKSKKATFTSPSDWPFPTVTCYATRKKKRDLPVLFVSKLTNQIVGLADDGALRTVEQQADRERGFSYPVFVAPVHLLLSFDDWCASMLRRMQVVA